MEVVYNRVEFVNSRSPATYVIQLSSSCNNSLHPPFLHPLLKQVHSLATILMADIAVPPPMFKKRTNNTTTRKRPAPPPPDDSATSASDYSSDEDGVRVVKRRRKEGVRVSGTTLQRPADLSKSTRFEADKAAHIALTDDATKTSHWYTEAAHAADAARATAKARATTTDPTDSSSGQQGTYQGTAKYSTFIAKSRDASERAVGPVKAPTNVRQITVTDFAPDVCKDYKQTGFCGFGDNCKFLHAREDYKQGWQLDKEWESAGKKKPDAKAVATMDEEEKLLLSIPFVCILCKEAYKRPVVTRCGHYFCEKCAMTRYMKEKKKQCANCGADTNGTFNMARKLSDLLERKRRRAEEAKIKAREDGEEVHSDDEEG